MVKRQAEELLAKVELTAAGNLRSGSYSGGMKRRLSVAIALLGDPKIVFLVSCRSFHFRSLLAPAGACDSQNLRVWIIACQDMRNLKANFSGRSLKLPGGSNKPCNGKEGGIKSMLQTVVRSHGQ